MANSEKLVLKFGMKNDKKSEIFHSSGYAQAASGANLGAAGGSEASFAARQALDEQRKYVKGYNNAKIMNSFYGVQRARTYVPRTEGGYGGAGGRGEAGGSSGNSSGLSGLRSSGGSEGSGGRQNPMDVAARRAQMNAKSCGSGISSTAANAKAPSVPSRRAGIGF